MDAKKTIKKYICPGAWMSVLGWLLAAVTVVSLILGLATLTGTDSSAEAAEFYPDESPRGTTVYIDVVGVSTWLYRYDDAVYYTVEDAEGYMYTVRLSDAQYNAMTAQQAYWERADENEPVPAPYHLVGLAKDIPSDVRESLAESWSITTAEYDQYFGTGYLNATTSAGQEASAGFFFVALLSFIFALLCLIFSLRAGGNAKKCLRQLEERGLLEKAAEQLGYAEGHTVIGKKRGILTQDFLFGKGTGVVVAYDDILWAYQNDRRRNFVVVNCYLMVATSFMSAQGAIDLNRADRQGTIGYALSLIAQRNPRVLQGFTSENVQAYKAMVRGE